MLVISPNNPEETKLEKKLHAILEPQEKLSATQFQKRWEKLDQWLEERDAGEDSYVTGVLMKASIDPGFTLHPDVLHDEVVVLLKILYQLRTCCPEIYDRRITEQFLIQVLWADVLSLADDDSSHVNLDSVSRGKLSLTPKKLQLLERSFQDASLAWQMALTVQESRRSNGLMMRNSISINSTEAFLNRWKELSGRRVEIEADDSTCQTIIRSLCVDEDDSPFSRFGGYPMNVNPQQNVDTARIKELISGVDVFRKEEPCPDLAEAIVRGKDMELMVIALNNNLISSDESEIHAAIEAARADGELKLIPMLIRKRWEAV